MEQDQQDQKKFLEQQLKRTEDDVRILDEMDVKLHEMKRIDEYASEHNLSVIKNERLSGELNVLKNEYSFLEKQLYPVLH
ncbi:hypothetical protein I6J18_16125 [Peribacillus psychrosaccharolyticus]|uniref:Uncharacterized protein n=1 Tax=Peribacillus psychrosaccharolyticus TaxID=1407 RepID=A0A974NK16_PERPY|nr:hypothetical protein [Peribacillus psychrosaccharolyticus]MEC2055483.1 hypothetical protein [Peribacillus psychrosaccharolyticus]MED3743489.1 hypothetical protein [Peribacillus psychrosaccharolyticus]QQS99160.1 hypothetical protein I6J18_16125 [Peribacillus psychrosaccharolyticus]